MCGFVGFIDYSNCLGANEKVNMVRTMSDRIRHRGPDDIGIWHDESAGVYLAHRRLSILDLSSAGHQPMVSSSGRFVIAFNGEVYNHVAIRKKLSAKDNVQRWRGHSDTEVILAAIESYGIRSALDSFVGMFAFVLWDRREHELILVRDRLGEKPLYWGRFGNTLLFGSELKALKAHSAFVPTINRNALALLMRYNYIPAPHSIYSGVEKLVPGTFLRFRYDCYEPIIEAYWSAKDVAEKGLREPWRGTENDAVDELETLLSRSVGGQMEADVPVGAFLSGGIDSSAVVALGQAQSSSPIKTFSIGFKEKGFDETIHARAVADYLGTDHVDLFVTDKVAQDVIPVLGDIYCEPFSDSSQIPTVVLSRLTRQHVTVSLSGDGGDELFCGYDRYAQGNRILRLLHYLPKPARLIIRNLILSASPVAWNRLLTPLLEVWTDRSRFNDLGKRMHRIASILRYTDPAKAYQCIFSQLEWPERLIIGSKEPASIFDFRENHPPFKNDLDLMSWLDLVTYLPDDILVKVDRAAMSVGLESRIPLLDHRIVEFALSLPTKIKLNCGQTKWPLKQVLYRHVPQEMFDRPKMGFGVPLGKWLQGPLRDWAECLLDDARLRSEGYFDADYIRNIWGQHLSGDNNSEHLLWSVLMFNSWNDQQ